MKYIVLLRGINIGSRKIKMDELKACLEEAGFKNVITVLQTGNVILECEIRSEKLRLTIENLLTQTFDYPAQVIVLTVQQVQHVVAHYPFTGYDSTFHRYAVFTEQENVENLTTQMGTKKLDHSLESIQASDGVVYWAVLKGHTLDSFFGKNMNKSTKKYFITNRNLNTLEKILKKCE